MLAASIHSHLLDTAFPKLTLRLLHSDAVTVASKASRGRPDGYHAEGHEVHSAIAAEGTFSFLELIALLVLLMAICIALDTQQKPSVPLHPATTLESV